MTKASSEMVIETQDRAAVSSTIGATKTPSTNSHLIERRKNRVLPWKNSRVLNEPPMNPWDFCAILGCLMPIAVCSVDLGLSLALRTSDAPRLMHAARVIMTAQVAKNRLRSGATRAEKAVASVNPEALPNKMYLITVSGLWHSRRNGTQG